jgi:hypothetical protein
MKGFTQTITGDEAAFAYIQETFTVPGAGMANLVFQGINDIAAWNLDDISLTLQSVSVPEPSTIALLGSALGMCFGLVAPVRRRDWRRIG